MTVVVALAFTLANAPSIWDTANANANASASNGADDGDDDMDFDEIEEAE
jgi:hypothetical protein